MKSLILLSVLASAPFSNRQEAAYELVWHPRLNDVLTYKMHLDIDSIPEKFTFTANLKNKILKIKPNGDYDVETVTKDAHVLHGGHDDPMTDDSKPTVDTYNSRGQKIASSEDTDPTEESNPGLNTLDSITDELTPKAPVHLGDTWSVVLQPNTKLKREAGKITYTLAGTEKQGAYNSLKITFKYTETEKSAPLTATGSIFINLQDSSLVRFDATLKGARFSADPDFPNGDATISVVRD